MNRKNRLIAALAFLIGTTLLVPATAFAQSNVSGLMTRLLDTTAKQSVKGYTRPGNVRPRMGKLEQNSQIEMSFRLRQGQKYGFVAVCDQNCNDIDLGLVDADGQLIEEDVDSDETAAIVYTAEETGVYDLAVIMPSCDQTECAYAVGVYRK